MRKVARIELTFELLRVVLGLIIAFGFSLLCIALVAEDPLNAVYEFSIGPFTTTRRFGQVMAKYIPYILSGCGMCFIYACGRFNLSGEGIVNFAPAIACLLVHNSDLLTDLPTILNLIIICLVCAIIGGIISFIPAWAREKLGVNEMVLSIILNTMLLFLGQWFVKIFMLDRNLTYVATPIHPDNMRFERYWNGSNFTAGIFVSIIGFIIAVVIFNRMRVGAKIKLCGSNPKFALYSGINIGIMMYLGQVIGGMFAGVAGAVDVFGTYDRYQYTLLTNIGMDGLIIAVLARKQPIFVPLAAFILAYIRGAAVVLNVTSGIPIEFVNMMQAVLIFFVAAQSFLSKTRNKMIFNMSRKQQEENKLKEAAV